MNFGTTFFSRVKCCFPALHMALILVEERGKLKAIILYKGIIKKIWPRSTLRPHSHLLDRAFVWLFFEKGSFKCEPIIYSQHIVLSLGALTRKTSKIIIANIYKYHEMWINLWTPVTIKPSSFFIQKLPYSSISLKGQQQKF